MTSKEMENDKILKSLKRHFKNHKTIIVEKQLECGDWENIGGPYQLIKVYDKNNIIIFSEVGYGNIVIIHKKNNRYYIASGKDEACIDNIVTFGAYYSDYFPIYVPLQEIK